MKTLFKKDNSSDVQYILQYKQSATHIVVKNAAGRKVIYRNIPSAGRKEIYRHIPPPPPSVFITFLAYR